MCFPSFIAFVVLTSEWFRQLHPQEYSLGKRFYHLPSTFVFREFQIGINLSLTKIT